MGWFQSKCNHDRLGSLWADAFRGHGFSLLEKTTLRGLQTHAIPAGVTALRSPRLLKLFNVIISQFCTMILR